MSSDLERRLEGLLGEAPEPDPGAGEEALHRALQALRPVAAPHRGIRTTVLVFAAIVVLLAIAAGSLAGAGALHVSFGQTKAPKHPATTRLLLPAGANGVAAIVDGRLTAVTKGGFRVQGLRATAAALSPHALFVAAGIGRSLVALAPDGRRPWSQAARGRVVAIAWAPDAIRILYIVQTRRHFVLHVIWGNGKHDTTIDRSVRAVRPSWRADSLAFAYVGGGGRAIVYDLAHRSRHIVGHASTVTRVAFAPAGKRLALGTPGSALLGGKTVAVGDIEALGWVGDRLVVASEMGVTPLLVKTFAVDGSEIGSFRLPGRAVAVTGGYVVTRRGPVLAGRWPGRSVSILNVPESAAVADVALR